MSKYKTAVLALGGNAISPKGEEDTIKNQFRNTRKTLKAVMNMVEKDYHIAITHGNGPQVGNAMLRVELANKKAPILPLGICVADTEGGMGYMIEQSLQNSLIQNHIERDVITIVTQITVDQNDPSIKNPTKYIGSWYSEDEIQHLVEEYNWQVKEVPGKGWRRVVPSPMPLNIINKKSIKYLVELGTIVITAGGGGIPVFIMDDGKFEGLDAVIDKDLASAVLARDIGAEELYILTEVDKVCLNFGKPNQEEIDRIKYKDLGELYKKGHFPPGSMGPKIQAAIKFLEWGGKSVVITSLENAKTSLDSGVGTIILP